MNPEYDALIIGTGQGGMPLSIDFAKAGWKTVIVERAFVGGTCINYGCTPTKTMVASARAAYVARRGADYGVSCGPVSVDMRRVRERKRQIVGEFRDGDKAHLERTENLALVFGEASFVGAGEVVVKKADGSEVNLKAKRVFVNTGGRPAVPLIPGLKDISWLDSTSIMELDEVPEKLVVIGGGYVALEFAQMFRRFGSEVVVLEHSPKFLPREDDDVSDALLGILREDGIEIRLGAEVTKVEPIGAGVRLHVVNRTIDASHVLVATGRTPNTETLGLEKAAVRTDDHGYIAVNEKLETSAANIWAIGDVKGGSAFTHISYDDYRILRTNLLAGGKRTTKDRPVPYVMFTDPQLGRVGMSESEAKASGKKFRVCTLAATSIARALETDECRGLLKAIVEEKTDQILGFTALVVDGGELMSAVELAMMGGLTATQLYNATFAHPALSESLNNLFTNG